jgi:ABC-2 type transport system permease protein
MSAPTGVIHDIGYQRYEGARLGRGYAVRSLYTHSLRTAYGLGRSAKAKVFPWLVVAIVAVVATVVTAVRAAVGEPVLSYPEFPGAVFVLAVLFGAVVAPELVSRDLRSGVLPLYFSRPLRRGDYALAKLAAMVSAVGLLMAGPMLIMLLGGVFSADGWGDVWDEVTDFAGGVALVLVCALVVGAIALLIASLVGRRAVAAGIVVGAFLVTLPVVGVLDPGGGHAPAGETARQLAGLANPASLLAGVQQWWFNDGSADIGGYGPLYGMVTLALVALCAGLLLLRYRRVAG